MGQSQTQAFKPPISMDDPNITMLNQEDLFLNSQISISIPLRDKSGKLYYGFKMDVENEKRTYYLTYRNTGNKASTDMLVESCHPKRSTFKGMIRGVKFRLVFKTTKYGMVRVIYTESNCLSVVLYIEEKHVRRINAALYNIEFKAVSSDAKPCLITPSLLL